MGRAAFIHRGVLVATEHDEQAALITWAKATAYTHPALNWLHAIPNGGHRLGRVGAMLKAEGVVPGVPDLCLPWPVAPYHGAYVEMKRMDGRATPAQHLWLAHLRGAGYAVEVCRGWLEAREFLMAYLKGRYSQGS
jgi:VRR-NUC domain